MTCGFVSLSVVSSDKQQGGEVFVPFLRVVLSTRVHNI